MELLADTHLHLYPCFDFDLALSTCMDKLSGDLAAAFLAERVDCNVYDLLSQGKQQLQQFTVATKDPEQLVLQRHCDGKRLLLVPGQQLIAAEGIEILALGTSARFSNGQAARSLIRSIAAQQGIPVLPWSPGKWFFQRGQVIDRLLHEFSKHDFLLGDVSLRPRGWGTPLLIRKAKNLGYQVIAGSDPLPFAHEEQYLGSYASQIITDTPQSSARAALQAVLLGQATARPWGKRCQPVETLVRLYRNAQVRKTSSRR